jgi:N-dimethylarginine dimethylaminohydrolase
MSRTGLDALRATSLENLEAWGFVIHNTRLDEIEKAGGSLRCMVAEIF